MHRCLDRLSVAVYSAPARERIGVPDRPRGTVTVCYHHRHRRDCMVTKRMALELRARVPIRSLAWRVHTNQCAMGRLHVRCQRPYTRRLRPTPRCWPACHSVPLYPVTAEDPFAAAVLHVPSASRRRAPCHVAAFADLRRIFWLVCGRRDGDVAYRLRSCLAHGVRCRRFRHHPWRGHRQRHCFQQRGRHRRRSRWWVSGAAEASRRCAARPR